MCAYLGWISTSGRDDSPIIGSQLFDRQATDTSAAAKGPNRLEWRKVWRSIFLGRVPYSNVGGGNELNRRRSWVAIRLSTFRQVPNSSPYCYANIKDLWEETTGSRIVRRVLMDAINLNVFPPPQTRLKEIRPLNRENILYRRGITSWLDPPVFYNWLLPTAAAALSNNKRYIRKAKRNTYRKMKRSGGNKKKEQPRGIHAFCLVTSKRADDSAHGRCPA